MIIIIINNDKSNSDNDNNNNDVIIKLIKNAKSIFYFPLDTETNGLSQKNVIFEILYFLVKIPKLKIKTAN